MGAMAERAMVEFKEELGWILDQRLRDFVLRVFDGVGEPNFWIRPASMSGKYHPAFSAGPGGLVRHTRLVAWWGTKLCRSMDNPDGTNNNETPHRDIVVSSCILHDLMKDGDPSLANLPERRQHRLITELHGVDIARAVVRVMYQNDHARLTRDELLVLYGCASHMGPWTKPAPYRPLNIIDAETRLVCTIVHLADFAAAQKVDERLPVLAEQAAEAVKKQANANPGEAVPAPS